MAALHIRRAPPSRTGISIVSMIDVMIILLFFFMVTSTYLNLDMVPAVDHSDDPAPASPLTSGTGAPATTILVRLSADGSTAIGGQVLSPPDLAQIIHARLADDPLTPVVILPSGGADMQALIGLMDTLTTAGALRLRVIRLDASP